MSETARLISTVKRLLKSRGLTYRDVAAALDLSEPSVKRLFASGRLTVERLEQIARLLGYTLAELSKEAADSRDRLDMLTEAQERELVSDTKLLVIAVCALNQWTPEEIVAHYRITENECLKCLLRLDRLRILDLLPGNRIRLNVARDFRWQPEGPIQQYFRRHGQADFLQSRFLAENESLSFANAMLTEQAAAQMFEELARLRQRMAMLHEESLRAPLEKRHGFGLLLAMRAWEPAEFARLKRQA